jgi:uncharacterized coiled-coil DUF342 family protein
MTGTLDGRFPYFTTNDVNGLSKKASHRATSGATNDKNGRAGGEVMKVADDGTTNPKEAADEIERLRDMQTFDRQELARLVAEIERLRFERDSARAELHQTYAEIERLKARLQLAQRWAAEAADALQPSAEENTRLRAEVERLTEGK